MMYPVVARSDNGCYGSKLVFGSVSVWFRRCLVPSVFGSVGVWFEIGVWFRRQSLPRMEDRIMHVIL
jgi:hypothetical protein